MAKIIEFYVPSSFKKKATKWVPPEECGKVIQFGLAQKEIGLMKRKASPHGASVCMTKTH